MMCLCCCSEEKRRHADLRQHSAAIGRPQLSDEGSGTDMLHCGACGGALAHHHGCMYSMLASSSTWRLFLLLPIDPSSPSHCQGREVISPARVSRCSAAFAASSLPQANPSFLPHFLVIKAVLHVRGTCPR